ncbi:AGRG6 protein, partial [Polypterus senegalus]|nr:adhesion G-protein coupled receptor G6-like [Polypterus senegalus]XP_039619141.1 adhesion G-protein coupled receptor G6-like [Polypterus senegalus]XP_039619142.1 adhesion G-protein coupled receptor G6-like [Polypterus senegalus]MBN3293262.1 AGRG6 protein [Polypterus senegalus]
MLRINLVKLTIILFPALFVLKIGGNDKMTMTLDKNGALLTTLHLNQHTVNIIDDLKNTLPSCKMESNNSPDNCSVQCSGAVNVKNSTVSFPNVTVNLMAVNYNNYTKFDFNATFTEWNASSSCVIFHCGNIREWFSTSNCSNFTENDFSTLNTICSLLTNYKENYNKWQECFKNKKLNEPFNGTTKYITGDNYKSFLKKISPEELILSVTITVSIPEAENSVMTPRISLPVEALAGVNNTVIAATVYTDPSQFIMNNKTNIVSTVISLDIIGVQNVSELKTPLVLVFPINQTADQSNKVFQCSFYEHNKGTWSDAGCHSSSSSNSSVTCSCNHLTIFAVLMVDPQVDAKNWQILTVISYVGCGLSAAFTAVTVLTYLVSRKSRRDHTNTIHVCLSAALYLLNMTFLLTEWVASLNLNTLCTIIAILMHYALLSSFSWMFVEAIHLYLLMVRVFNTYIKKYITKLSAFAWGIPAIIVGIVASVRQDYYGPTPIKIGNSSYTNNICWISNKTYFYALNISYFTIVFIFNCGILIAVTTKIVYFQRFAKDPLKTRSFCKDCSTVLILTCLLGTTWGLAYLGYGLYTLPVLYLFTIFNSFQGLFIFFWICAAQRKNKTQSDERQCATNTDTKEESLFPGIKINPDN